MTCGVRPKWDTLAIPSDKPSEGPICEPRDQQHNISKGMTRQVGKDERVVAESQRGGSMVGVDNPSETGSRVAVQRVDKLSKRPS